MSLPYAPVAHYHGEDHPVDHCVPYRVLDGYGRSLEPFAHRTLVLESDRLRATFLPDLGGRLWSLVHKPTGRELLYVNPVIQPANFAVRNAWFSGGIEWNVGIFGHSVFTCSPVFCGRTVAPDGSDGLRVWEYERFRGVAWQVDFWAPDGSDFLFYMPRIVNPNEKTVPMYWWTCIAVTEEPDGRVLAPTDRAIEPGRAMGEDVSIRDLVAEPDITYPQQRDLPRDTYFDIPDGERPWIAHVSDSGEGVVHLSSELLKGRKQWVWGMERCGRRWQDWLSPGGPPYIEIQGGLAKKQSDYVPMPGLAEWSWLEAYGPLQVGDPSDWAGAVERARSQIGARLPEAEFGERESAMRLGQRSAVAEVLCLGSGWGALEEARRAADGEGPLLPEGPRFPGGSMGEPQRPWRTLLEGAPMPAPDACELPGDSCTGQAWSRRLRESASDEPSWAAWLHLGVAEFAAGSPGGARRCWELSLEAEPSAWAHRNLAVLAHLEGDPSGACEHMVDALGLLPEEPHLVDEACRTLALARRWDRLEALIGALAPSVLGRARVRLARAQAALARGDLAAVRGYFEPPCDLVDMREAETTVGDLWRGLCEADPSAGDPARPPWEYDFRMV